MKRFQFLLAAALAGGAGAATAADVSVSVGGQISPGVYGRIDIHDGAPPPPLVYAQPVIIARPAPTVVVGPPVYLHVPPGHAKNWRKHCGEYNACGRQVYFVKSAEYEPGYGRKHRHDDDDDRGHGHGKGRHD